MNDTNNMTKLLDLLSQNLSVEDLRFASIASDLSLEIVRQRVNMNYTQAEFAKYLGVTQAMVSKWENGDYNFTIKSLISLSQKLNLDLKIALRNPSLNSYVGINSDTLSTDRKKSKIVAFPNSSPTEWSSTSSGNSKWSTNEHELKEM